MFASASNRGYAQLAIGVLARTAPGQHAALAAGVRTIPGAYRIGGETFAIVERDGTLAFDDVSAIDTVLDVTIEPADLVRLVDGNVTLETLLAHERLRIFAAPEALLVLARVVAALLEGTIHQRALRDLFEDYRGFVAAGRLRSPRSSRAPRRSR
ncbi:MAG: hypothetical protein M3N49_14780 [Candidatus Eremiobacteraeota bacterium]|nr:hypothetical protein [Candidatus Eremiobacteraeota bacterium]